MKILLIYFSVLLLSQNSTAQEVSHRLEYKIKQKNFSAVERIIKNEVRKNKKGQIVNNGSSSYTSHKQTIDNLVIWLKKHEGVEEVFSDKCEMKISIYPGWSVIGVKYKEREKEICYKIQEGRLGNCKLGKKIHFHIFATRNVLKYIKSYDQEDFIINQKRNCQN